MHPTLLRRGTVVLVFVASFLLPGRWAWGQG